MDWINMDFGAPMRGQKEKVLGVLWWALVVDFTWLGFGWMTIAGGDTY